MFDPVSLYRVYHRLWRRRVPMLPAALYRLNRLVTGCDLPPSVVVGCDPGFAHWGLVVAVGPNTIIGDHCRLYPACRVLPAEAAEPWPQVTIGDRVQIGVGAVILAQRDLAIGNDAQIGAGALVVESVPAGATIVRCSDIHLRDRHREPQGRRGHVANPVTIHAVSRWLYLRKVPWLPGLFYRLNYLLNRCILAPTSRMSSTARVGRWVALSFANLGPGVVLEDGVVIARNVRHRRAVQDAYIEIEAGAKIGAQAIIVGADGMRIGEGARVEAGAVVHKSVPSGCNAAGVPARIVAPPTGKTA